MKRVLVVSDFHCGHRVGLTPPAWQGNNENPANEQYATMRKELWKFYSGVVKSLKPVDILIVNGDAIDGKGDRSGGTELIIPDVTDQCKMAEECINLVGAKDIVMTYGTPYHAGVISDFENVIADGVGATIGGHEWVSVNGLIFDIKHFVGGSVVPYGRLTSLERDKIWNELWAIDDLQPRADVIIRSHVHAYNFSGDANTLSIKTPALQGFGSKFGTRVCTGTVDIGLIYFDVENDGGYTWDTRLLKGEFLKARALKL